MTRKNIYDMVQSETGITNIPTNGKALYLSKGVFNMYNNFDLTGKTVVVTGAETGIGSAAALAYAEAGAQLALLCEDIEKAEQIKEKIDQMGGRALIVQCDVTSEKSVRRAIKAVLQNFDKVDILLNNSDIALKDGLENMQAADWNRAFGKSLRGVYFVSRQLITHMKNNGYGKIINVSTANSRSTSNLSRWEVSPRDMVASLTKDLARLYAQYGISVNTIGPDKANKDGFVNAILYLSSDEAKLVVGQFVDERHAAIA